MRLQGELEKARREAERAAAEKLCYILRLQKSSATSYLNPKEKLCYILLPLCLCLGVMTL